MKSDNLTTGVDSLLEFLRQKNGKVALTDAAKALGLSENAIKLWTDFLIEEKIIGIEYKFTKPYIYLNSPTETKKSQIIGEEKISLETFRNEFIKRGVASNIPKEQIDSLWMDHLMTQLKLKKQYFEQEARKRGFESGESLWSEYMLRVKAQKSGA